MPRLCNEGECNAGYNHTSHRWITNATLDGLFRGTTKALDPTRPVSGNMWAEYGPGTLTDFLDVQGISHPSAGEIAGIRGLAVPRPLIASECCSCQSQRGEDTGTVPPDGVQPAVPADRKRYSAFNGDCLQREVNLTDALPYVAGSMIWTLGDYLGEPEPIGWPQVSSAFGAVDLAGFPKAGARWFEAWWLRSGATLLAQASRPPLPVGDSVHIVESNQPPPPGGPPHRTIHVYTSAATAELLQDGASLGPPARDTGLYGWLEWNTTVRPGNLTAVARDAAGRAVAVHTRVTAGPAAAIVLTVDAPAARTATGGRVLLDGHDVALVRATLRDARGAVAPDTPVNITFGVAAGPGRVLGVGNGDPFCKEPHTVPWRSTYRGLARAIVKVTVDAAAGAATRALLRRIDADTGRSLVTVADPTAPFAPQSITVTATAAGFPPAAVVIPVSVDAEVDGVVATARASGKLPVALD